MEIKSIKQLINYVVFLSASIILITFLTAARAEPTANEPSLKSSEIMAQGTIVSIDSKNQQLTINHQAIAALNWPAMTMNFSVEPKVSLNDVKAGDSIQFGLQKTSDGSYSVTSIKKLSN
ncbi:TPA: copper-binding protein [Legionella pneumophila]|nr:copper-binding protein [Legionella pneumophila]HAU2406560.1 copper-binding protein [Legionella pneumophila]